MTRPRLTECPGLGGTHLVRVLLRVGDLCPVCAGGCASQGGAKDDLEGDVEGVNEVRDGGCRQFGCVLVDAEISGVRCMGWSDRRLRGVRRVPLT